MKQSGHVEATHSMQMHNGVGCKTERVKTVNSAFYSIRSTTLSTLFEYNTVQEIFTNKQVSVSLTLKIAAISVMIL